MDIFDEYSTVTAQTYIKMHLMVAVMFTLYMQ